VEKDFSDAAFRALVEPLERELHAYAYRMLGGFHDADDAMQESRLKAWRARETYEPRASFRAWMYRIVTNTCLDMLKARSRRVLPQDICPPVAPGPPTTAPRDDIAWLEPYPDALLPDDVAHRREGIRLAFVRVVQVLPPRQRAALILHDVLDRHLSPCAAIALRLRTGPAHMTAPRPSPRDVSNELDDGVLHLREAGLFERVVTSAFEHDSLDRYLRNLGEGG